MTHDMMAGHQLIGVSASGETCECGNRSPSVLEHLADVALAQLGAERSAPKITRKQKSTSRDPRRDEVTITDSDTANARNTLAALAAEQTALAAQLEAAGLVGFVERSDWLIVHQSPLDALAWDLKWARLGLPGPYLPEDLLERRSA